MELMDKQDEIFYVISFYKKNDGTYFVTEDIEGNLYKTKFRSKAKLFENKEEQETAKNAAEVKAYNEKILALIHQKQEGKLAEKSVEELQALLK